ncbi:MAG TPA: thioredoxin fold domain-containing protein, partial [Thermoanaerobaculia bacterium]|nr:thioredoxin fold domain-containing protein [Thermoanaerobaculia bacterium]
MKTLVLALGLGVVAAGASTARAEAPPAAASVHVPFLEGHPFAEVKKRARAEKKAILLDVVASWCGPCKLMDKTTFSDASVVDWSKKRVVPYRVDAEKGEGRRVAERYAVRSYPTVVFLDADGNEIDRLSGAFQADAFKESGDRILKGDAPLARGLADLKAAWTYDKAYSLARELATRGDLRRLRPIVSRMVEEDPDLARTETIEIFTYLAALEDVQSAVRPETAD